MTKTLAEREQANRDAAVPPGFGTGKSWRMRVVEWVQQGADMTVLIHAGMPVSTSLHAYYWAELESYRGMLTQAAKAGVTLSEFVLMKLGTSDVVGAGAIHPDDDAADIAWLSCMFGEMSELQMGFVFPDDPAIIDLSSVKGAKRSTVYLDQAASATRSH